MPRKKQSPSADELNARLEQMSRQAAALKKQSEQIYAVVESTHARADALHQRIRNIHVGSNRKKV